MHMQDWLQRVDDFLKMTGNDILTHAGTVSHQQALDKAKEEYVSYRESLKNELSKVEQDFVQHLEQTHKQLKKKNKGN
ncbi:hypothetical protein D3C85_1723950 [compost metagenome]